MTHRGPYKRRHQPPREPLDYAAATHKSIADAYAKRVRAFRAAAAAGWTMREIGDATGLSFATVWRIIDKAEREAAS